MREKGYYHNRCIEKMKNGSIGKEKVKLPEECPIEHKIKYPIIGVVDEDKYGCWFAEDCNCSGYIDENYDNYEDNERQ
ncbi:hypothetical protein AKJ59_00615 [candidate division MSBL1 archaeon SCGC-AAA385M02]|uniref:Uncharacterized protein n=1 Tax=candidate division MSBL1 archaeon SCGC-AAA385M02 TaxID=1698287 RepID=A0A133VQH7_9EURY|nr:hypothetical protein AKJ59_00615 [candidate division MSBL1 archaeon SCGC-AAA385M02]